MSPPCGEKYKEDKNMSKTASLVMKIVGAGLALAAFVCLLIGYWGELACGAKRVCGRIHPACKEEE